MRGFLSVFKRELRAYFNTPLAYVFLVIFLIFSSYLFFQNDFFHRLAAWFHDDPATRPISPLGAMTRERFVANRIGERFEEGLLEAIHIDPDNGIALARLTARNAETRSGTDPLSRH